jgi:hypothetical protein
MHGGVGSSSLPPFFSSPIRSSGPRSHADFVLHKGGRQIGEREARDVSCLFESIMRFLIVAPIRASTHHLEPCLPQILTDFFTVHSLHVFSVQPAWDIRCVQFLVQEEPYMA